MPKTQSLIVASIALALPASFVTMIPKAHASNYYGAIAYSPRTGMIGYSYDYASFSSAPNGGYSGGWDSNKSGALFNALQSCRQHNRSCSISRWVCTTR